MSLLTQRNTDWPSVLQSNSKKNVFSLFIRVRAEEKEIHRMMEDCFSHHPNNTGHRQGILHVQILSDGATARDSFR